MLPLRASQISQVGAYCVPHSTVHGLAIEANGDQMYCGEKKESPKVIISGAAAILGEGHGGV
jgi:uncharacterized Zn-binding protein involved in type VI secretion